MSKSQRVKGAGGEREWIAKLASFGIKAKRHLGQARDGGGDVPAPPILWEVKRRGHIATHKFTEQCEIAVANAKAAGDLTTPIPAVAMRGDEKPWLVVMAADDFLRLLTTGKL